MLKKAIPWENSNDSEALALRKQISDFLKQDGHNAKEKKDHSSISAELNVLSRLGLTTSDRVVLLASDNAQGRVCAEMLKKTIVDAFGLSESAVEVLRVEGLQVLDARKLREQGLKNLVKLLYNYLSNEELAYTYDIILNPTGGFKGVVPFVTIMGMLYGKRSVYIFEFAEELINLPPLPFSFDIDIYNRVKFALEFLSEEVAVPEEVYLSKVVNYVPEERDLFMAFTEPWDTDKITPSPLAYCLLKMEDKDEKPMIAESALKNLNEITGSSVKVLKRLIKNSTSPMWRTKKYHTVFTSDLTIIKQGHTTERIAGFVRDGQFLITNVFSSHDDYTANIGKYQRKDFQNVKFVPYETEEYLGVDESDQDGVITERDELLDKVADLSKKVKDAEISSSLAEELEKSNAVLKDKLIRTEVNLAKKEEYLTGMKNANFFSRLKFLFGGKI
jgi:putative CRISPR-associated protein (TIGR02619 family)